jgi:hypothetical protein
MRDKTVLATTEPTAPPPSTTRPVRLTPERIEAALRRGAEGAHELEKSLKGVFELSEKSATLRLR